LAVVFIFASLCGVVLCRQGAPGKEVYLSAKDAGNGSKGDGLRQRVVMAPSQKKKKKVGGLTQIGGGLVQPRKAWESLGIVWAELSKD